MEKIYKQLKFVFNKKTLVINLQSFKNKIKFLNNFLSTNI